MSPLPRLNWTDGGVEEVEEITAKLLTSKAMCFAVVSTHDNGDTRLETRKLLRLGAARGGGEREAMEQASAFGQALAFFWSSDV